MKLQYTHARLTSLLNKCQEFDNDTSLGDLLTEQIAVELVWVISRCDKEALKLLSVKNEETPDQAAAIYKLFSAARLTLADGMTVLGIRPFDRI